MSEENWDDVIDMNLKSVFNLTKASQETFWNKKVVPLLIWVLL